MSMFRTFQFSRYSSCSRRLFTYYHLKNQSTTKSIAVGKLSCPTTIVYKKKQYSTFRKFSSFNNCNISNVSNIESDALLRIEWDDDTSYEFPHIFLRDNCQCSRCFHEDAKTRQLYKYGEIDVDIFAQSVSLQENTIELTWPDGHTSEYTSQWLRDHIFSDSKSKPTFGIEQKYWDSELINTVQPILQYSDWIDKDESAMKSIEYLLRYGICIIKNGPPGEATGRQICKRIGMGYNKITHYGDTFSVRTKPIPSNIAYTSNFLPLHMDLPYLRYQPDIQYLHCIKQSDGDDVGANVFSDGFLSAEKLKIDDREAFDILSETIVQFNDVGCDQYGEFDIVYERSTIEFDNKGRLATINFSNLTRSSHIQAPSHKIKDFYRALYKLESQLNDEKHIYKMKLEPGDTVTFDNRRVLHGRTSYEATNTNRWLEGGYLEWDYVLSKYRNLRKRVNNSKCEKNIEE